MFVNIIAIIYGDACTGVVFEPKSTPCRAIVACVWIYAVVVVSIYNGNLIATLTAPRITTIDTLEQLDNSGLGNTISH